ncbi:hypothetical protein [Streptomyces sp. NPDC002540]
MSLGAQLPAERLLAGELGLARGTVTTGYQILRVEQLIVTLTGSGSTVSLPPRPHERVSPWPATGAKWARTGHRWTSPSRNSRHPSTNCSRP